MPLAVYNVDYVNKCLARVADRKDELDLVVLPGLARTGTTILFQCIRGTNGFRELFSARLLGTPPSEHQSWRIVNYLIAKHLGAKALQPGTPHDIGHGDILYGTDFAITEKPLDEYLIALMEEAMKVFSYQKLKVVKDPMCQFALEAWINRYKSFKNAKYVWTRRNLMEAAKSLVRFKVPALKGVPRGYRGLLTVKRALEIAEQQEAELERVMPMVNHIEVWHHDLVNNTKKTFAKISDFLGKEIDQDKFDRGKIWKSLTPLQTII